LAIGVVGKKCGMPRIFTEDGVSVPVTVIEVTPNRVTQVNTVDVDGYDAVQITTGSGRSSRVVKAAAGHYAKAGVEAGRGLWEFRLDAASEYESGSDLPLAMFEAGQKVDVTCKYIGKGFAGGV